jgi:hypothetical protein
MASTRNEKWFVTLTVIVRKLRKGEKCKSERQKIGFLKTHKTASRYPVLA